MKQWIKKTFFGYMIKPPVQTLEEKAIADAMALERDILQRELKAIEDQHLVQAARDQRTHIINWLNQRDQQD